MGLEKTNWDLSSHLATPFKQTRKGRSYTDGSRKEESTDRNHCLESRFHCKAGPECFLPHLRKNMNNRYMLSHSLFCSIFTSSIFLSPFFSFNLWASERTTLARHRHPMLAKNTRIVREVSINLFSFTKIFPHTIPF